MCELLVCGSKQKQRSSLQAAMVFVASMLCTGINMYHRVPCKGLHIAGCLHGALQNPYVWRPAVPLFMSLPTVLRCPSRLPKWQPVVLRHASKNLQDSETLELYSNSASTTHRPSMLCSM